MIGKWLLFTVLFFLAPQMSFGQNIRPYSIGIIVEDLEKSSEWYGSMFGAEVYKKISYPGENVLVHLLKTEEVEFELVQRNSSFSIRDILPQYDNREKPVRGFYKLSFEVENIEKIYKMAKDKGAEIYFDLSRHEEFKMTTFITRDPDGNLIQFVEKIKE